jgi:hypothetical protein
MKDTARQGDEITVPQLVHGRGINPVTLYRLISMGRVQARRDQFGRWQVNLQSFEAWRAKHPSKGKVRRPRQGASVDLHTLSAPGRRRKVT